MRLISYLWKQVERVMMHNCSAEEEIARWKATAEQEAAVGTGVEQEFVAQGKCGGEPSLALKSNESRLTTSVPRFTEDHNHQAIISAGQVGTEVVMVDEIPFLLRSQPPSHYL